MFWRGPCSDHLEQWICLHIHAFYFLFCVYLCGLEKKSWGGKKKDSMTLFSPSHTILHLESWGKWPYLASTLSVLLWLFFHFSLPPCLVFENTHLQPAPNHAPCFSNLLTPSDLQLYVWWVAKELWLPGNLTLYNIYYTHSPTAYTIPKEGQQTTCVCQGLVFWLKDYLCEGVI